LISLFANKWVIAGMSVILMTVGAYLKGRLDGNQAVQDEWNAEKVLQLERQRVAEQQARDTEQAWQATVDELRKGKDRAIQNADSRHKRLLASLRERPETRADGGMPEGAEVAVGCTGEGLARADGEFLAGYAADAAKLQAAYDQCRLAYEQLE
jgi:hypothetical protein